MQEGKPALSCQSSHSQGPARRTLAVSFVHFPACPVTSGRLPVGLQHGRAFQCTASHHSDIVCDHDRKRNNHSLLSAVFDVHHLLPGLGALAMTAEAERARLDPTNVVAAYVMPCTAQQYQWEREEMVA